MSVDKCSFYTEYETTHVSVKFDKKKFLRKHRLKYVVFDMTDLISVISQELKYGNGRDTQVPAIAKFYYILRKQTDNIQTDIETGRILLLKSDTISYLLILEGM